MSLTSGETSEFPLSHGPLLLTVDEVGALLKVSIRTIWRMRSASQIPNPVRIGGGVRWRLSEIEDWIAKGCPDHLKVQN